MMLCKTTYRAELYREKQERLLVMKKQPIHSLDDENREWSLTITDLEFDVLTMKKMLNFQVMSWSEENAE